MTSQTPFTSSARSAGRAARSSPTRKRHLVAVPQTREEYLHEQEVVQEIFDPLSGRTRLVKGTGEIVERIVTKQQHRDINKAATAMDGTVFSAGSVPVARP
ncbi:ADP-ribosylation factor-like protein 6-interacting protein 4 [Thoreauomyces humboldtii]|nr:ADP-ribosylation factor-like protein 6-interacting protein 4 [Thoreauomyces humboldtii]